MTDPADPDDEPLPSLAAGALIGEKYRIEGLIGRGGMGSVWSAVHVSLGQRVAVKLIAKRFAASREARHRFDLEARAVAQLRSRYVVQVYDHGETPDGTPYIVMEYLDGESLDARISRGPLPVHAAALILDQIGRALGRAHQLGMVHRDLKPENVFLTTSPDGDGEIAKVLDFGIVKMKGNEGIGSSTRTGAVLGTPLYMSPEQARGLKSVDHRTDLYSLGMLAYTMLTGQPAFTGESLADLLVAICTQPLPNVRARAGWVPLAVEGWFARACAREPADRFASAEELTTSFALAAGLRPRAPADSAQGPAIAAPLPHAPSAGALHASASHEGPVPGVTAPSGHTAAPLSVTGQAIPKRSLTIPLAAGAGLLILGGVLVVMRLEKSPSAEPGRAPIPSAASLSPSASEGTTAAAPPPSPPSATPPTLGAPSSSSGVPVAPPAARRGRTPALPAHAAHAAPAAQPAAPAPTRPHHVDLGF